MTSTPFRRWDWYSAGLLLVLVFTAAARLSITNWTSQLGFVETVALLGTGLGLALGGSPWLERRAVRWLVFDYSMIVIPWQLLGLVGGEMSVPERLSIVGIRLGVTFTQFMAAKRIDDPIFFLTLMIVLYWIISMYSAFGLMRGSSLLHALVPPTFAILLIQYYDVNQVANRIWILGFYFILVLLLMGRVNILQNRAVWQARRVFTGSEPEFDLGAGIVAVAVALVVIAWITPTPAAAIPAAARMWQEINRPLDAARQRINNMLAAVESGSKTVTETYGSSLALGVNARQGTEAVFAVTPPSLDFPRYYWRMRVYDTYEAGNWSASSGFSEEFSPDQASLSIPDGGSAQGGDFLFDWKSSPTILLPLPSQPEWVSRDGQVQLIQAGADQVDVLSWHTDQALQPGDRYTARAVLLNPNAPELRGTSTNYPDWVNRLYLQLPANLPQDIRDLALKITVGQSTPYDKAAAITTYLRQNITYSLSVPAVPSGADPLKSFLFSWKTGFCNYYASAEVVLLRAVGVPARLAVGYAQGQLQQNGAFIVEQQDSHAWPEVYFPRIGWVNFEPTASQPAIVRVDDSLQGPVAPLKITPAPNVRPPTKKLEEDQGSPDRPAPSIAYQTLGVWVIILVIGSIVVYGLRLLDRKKPFGRRIPWFARQIYGRFGIEMPAWLARWERWSESTEVERAFQAVNQSLAWLGAPQPLHATPAERAEQLKILLPPLAADVDTLHAQLEQTLFSRTPGDPAKAAHAARVIRFMTVRAVLQRWLISGAKR